MNAKVNVFSRTLKIVFELVGCAKEMFLPLILREFSFIQHLMPVLCMNMVDVLWEICKCKHMTMFNAFHFIYLLNIVIFVRRLTHIYISIHCAKWMEHKYGYGEAL